MGYLPPLPPVDRPREPGAAVLPCEGCGSRVVERMRCAHCGAARVELERLRRNGRVEVTTFGETRRRFVDRIGSDM